MSTTANTTKDNLDAVACSDDLVGAKVCGGTAVGDDTAFPQHDVQPHVSEEHEAHVDNGLALDKADSRDATEDPAKGRRRPGKCKYAGDMKDCNLQREHSPEAVVDRQPLVDGGNVVLNLQRGRAAKS